MNRNVFVDNNKKPGRRDSRKGSSSRPTEHRLPGQRSIEQEFQVEPASSRTESVDIDWEGIGIPIPEQPGSRRGSDEPEILSDDLLAMEEASRRDSEDASPFHILNLDPYFKPPPAQESLEKIMKAVTEMGIQKQESGDSENTDSGAKRQDSKAENSPRGLNSRHQDSELNLCDSEASRQKDSKASSRSVENSGNSGRRQDSGDRQNHGNHRNRRQDSPRRQDNQGFRSGSRSLAPSNGGPLGRRQDSENRQDLRQDSPRHQNGSGFRNRSRSPAPSNDGFSRRRQDSGDRQNRRQDSPRRQEDRGFRSPSRRRQDSEDRHPDHQILLLLKTILPKLLWARAMDLKQIFVCHGHHAIFEFMENPDDMNGMDDISNRLKTILSQISYLKAIEIRDILEEAGGNDIWRFMKGEPINQGNQERFEDRNRQNQINNRDYDGPTSRNGQYRSPDRQSQRNYSPDRRDGDDGRYRSPDRQRRDFSADRRSRSPIRNGQYRPDSPDRRSNHSNHDEPKIAKSNGRLMQKAEWSFNWDGARRQLKEMISRRLQYPDFVPFFNDPDVRAACEARGYTNPGLTQTMNRLKNMKRTAPPTRELMCQIRKEEDIRSSNKVCILCCYELWKAAH